MQQAPHDIKIDNGSHEWVADAIYNDDTKRWEISISEDGWHYDGNNIDYTTRKEELRAAFACIIEDINNTDEE